jgi:hypothetical protein
MLKVVLSLVLLASAARAEIQDAATNMEGVFSDMKKFVEDLSREETGNQDLAEDYYAGMPEQRSGYMDQAYFQQSLENPYRKNATMNDLGGLALAGWGAIGTVQQAAMAAKLLSAADQLDKSGDPQYQQIAGLYRQEAAAMENFDEAGAKSLADQVNQLERPDTSKYSPTAADAAFANRSAKNTAKVVGGVIRVAANVVGALIGAYYGCTSCGLAIGGAVGGAADTAVTANAAGDTEGVDAAGGQLVDSGVDTSADYIEAWGERRAAKLEADREAAKQAGADSSSGAGQAAAPAKPMLPTGGTESGAAMPGGSMPGAGK